MRAAQYVSGQSVVQPFGRFAPVNLISATPFGMRGFDYCVAPAPLRLNSMTGNRSVEPA